MLFSSCDPFTITLTLVPSYATLVEDSLKNHLHYISFISELCFKTIMNRDLQGCRAGLFKQKKSGQTVCPKCSAKYNNAVVPDNCNTCDHFLGGKYRPKEIDIDAKLLTSNLASIRVNLAGINVRTFVDIGESRKVKTIHNVQNCSKVGGSKIKISHFMLFVGNNL